MMQPPSKPHTLRQVRSIIRQNKTLSSEEAKRFFKTGKDHYGEKDKFIGITVPNLRKIAKQFYDVDLLILQKLLESDFNEERLLALFILINQYNNADLVLQNKLFQFYLKNLGYVNNWNLVDASAHLIIGQHLSNKSRAILLKLAKSKIMWERRVAIVSTWAFIKQDDLDLTLKIAHILLQDNHDLIHKSVGWMLRELGKRDEKTLRKFLDQYAEVMPRTMLRYAIEKFSPALKNNYMKLKMIRSKS
jgi:3-methyladenine DNA glycosylase AlkD